MNNIAVIQALEHVVMFVPSVRAAAEWYSSVLQLPASFMDLFGLIGTYNGAREK